MSNYLVETITLYQQLYRGIDWDDFEPDEAEDLARWGEQLIQDLAREIVLTRRKEAVA